MRVFVLLALAAAAVVLASAQDPGRQVCGTWQLADNGQGCLPLGETGLYYSQKVTMAGITSGPFNIERLLYANLTDCKNPDLALLQMSGEGVWVDYGPAAGNTTEGLRNLVVQMNSVTLLPFTQVEVDELNKDCPCGKEDSGVQVTRVITTCAPGTCTDPSFFNSVPAGLGGIKFGEFMFGTYLAQGTDIKTVQITAWFQDSLQGFAEQIDDTKNQPMIRDAGTDCDEARSAASLMCGLWNSTCRPIVPNSAQFATDMGVTAMSVDVEFDIDPLTMQEETGLFYRRVHYYKDTMCFDFVTTAAITPAIGFYELGLMTHGGAGAIDGAQDFQQQSLNLRMKVWDADILEYMKAKCPCGNALDWQLNTHMDIAFCPPDECDFSFYNYFNTSVDVGDLASGQYSVMARGAGDIEAEPEFRSTAIYPGTDGYTIPSFVPNNWGYSKDRAVPCANGMNTTNDFCGVWKSDCRAASTDDALSPAPESNILETLEIHGNGAGPSDQTGGVITYTREIFDWRYGCDTGHLTMTVAHFGTWSDYSPNENVNSIQDMIINFGQLTATPFTTDMVGALNIVCPCNGNWEINKARTLSFCPAGTCDSPQDLFGGSPVIGTPGFALWTAQEVAFTHHATGPSIRFSDIGLNATRLEQPFGLTGFPLSRSSECPPEEPFPNACGFWQLPCTQQQDSPVLAIYDTTGTLNVEQDGSSYALIVNHFSQGMACNEDTALQIAIEILGSMDLGAGAANVANGKEASLTPSSVIVTAFTVDAANLLNANCKCGGDWVALKPRKLDGLCLGPCTADLFWQPPAETGYGVVQMLGNTNGDVYIRISDLLATQADGFKQRLTINNPAWALTDDVCKQHQKTSKKKGGIDTGGILLLVFFFSLFAYFGAGMALNYKNTGSPVIPHADFWRDLPALVFTGVNFSVCQLCGLRGGSGGKSYASLDNDAGGYGTL